MDDENKQEQQNEGRPEHQHVHIFGAEVNGGGAETGENTNPGVAKTASETKEEWRARKQQWKQEHRAQREAQRAEWHKVHGHEGGMFWGLVILLVGVLALLDTMGYVSTVFWHAIIPFWPLLLILWGASLVLGRHWFARFVLFIFALAFLIIVILYGLVRADSPLVSSLSPNVVRAVQVSQPQQ